MEGIIFDVQRFSVHDGPGIRTTVFCKGCSLRCAWCHNPEGLSPAIGLQFFEEECLGCGRCGGRQDADAAALCAAQARRLCGRRVTADALAKELLADRDFYGAEGGVTFSGGECLLQADFLTEVMCILAREGVSSVIDTAGHVPWESIEKTLPLCDHYLYDIKCADAALHRQYTGQSNDRILANLARLAAVGKRLWIRVPVIPGVNDHAEEMRAIATLAARAKPEQVTLMPYHTLGKSKYKTLFLSPGYEAPYMITPAALEDMKRIFREHGLPI